MAFITPDEFEYLANFIYRKTGIRFEIKKLYFLSKRVQKRMEELGIQTASEYMRKLRFSDPDNSEFQLLLNLLTINETYFFRDFPQLQAFAEHCLPDIIEKKEAAGNRRLRIWSAGCASGEEPYTIGIILYEMLNNYRQWDIKITASDVDQNMLKKQSRQYMKTEVSAMFLKNIWQRILQNQKDNSGCRKKSRIWFKLNTLILEIKQQ
ncbi:Chemotaxis protein methyltransferase [Desulfonema limicola]|uniref:protein-glutamate O-methyltransferase n=1 Tax=Desulfonema limicola TaxID=45656 RepID=A0A975B368_9BACT|nr:CheR family methyltransferase [Desulfonema limicola]QTA77943.1 Chemotaxis protein methyltransferase [Desulfonema limicola]